MRDDWLSKLHELEMMIAKEIKRICEKNHIRYFLIAGSALGAVRHGGFIPWDDDMDFGMLREEYEKFIKACEKDLDGRFFLQTWDSDPDYPMSYAKIRILGTHFVEEFSENAKMNNGIFVDIFPYDNVPDSKISRKIQAMRYFVCVRMLWIKKGMGQNLKNKSIDKRIKYYVFLTLSMPFSYNKVKEYFRRVQQKYNKNRTDKIVIPFDTYEKIVIKRKWTDQCEYVKFEDDEFPLYKNKNEYLTCIIGDYMKLPPEEKRQGHLPVQIDFGTYN